MPATKGSLLAARLSPEQDVLIRHTADPEGASITVPTVDAAVARARDVLAYRRLFMVDDAAWAEFLVVLDRPVAHQPKWKRCSPVGRSLGERVLDTQTDQQ